MKHNRRTVIPPYRHTVVPPYRRTVALFREQSERYNM